MLTINNPAIKGFNEKTEEFITIKECAFTIEHSLVSISKWEAKFKKPFFSNKNNPRSESETKEYIKCMTVTPNVPDYVYDYLTKENIIAIKNYMEDPMTATTFPPEREGSAPSMKSITTEEIYWQMINFNIPMEFQKWHINRLLTLIKICNLKNAPAKKMSKHEIMSRNRSLNAARRKALNSNG